MINANFNLLGGNAKKKLTNNDKIITIFLKYKG